MKKYYMNHLVWTMIFSIAAVILYFYNDPVGVGMMAIAAIGISLNYILRKTIIKNEPKKDEMVKRISGMSSDIALYLSIISIGVLTILLHFLPTLFDVFEILGILLTVMLVSKIAFQLYYSRMKDEIGF